MTPKITTRSFSNDQFYLDNVFYQNYYKLKGQKNTKKTVVDIGAHIGAFSFMALMLGATKVYAFEPHVDSFSILLQNIYNNHFSGRVTPYQCGIYTEPITGLFATPELVDSIYFDFGGVKLESNKEENYYPCRCITLDEMLQTYCYLEYIDILKINLGYLEREVLLSSSLYNINSICGEVTVNEQELADFKKSLGVKRFVNFYSLPPNPSGRVLFWASISPLSDNFVLNIP